MHTWDPGGLLTAQIVVPRHRRDTPSVPGLLPGYQTTAPALGRSGRRLPDHRVCFT